MAYTVRMLCLLTIFHFPVFIFVNAALWTSRIYFFSLSLFLRILFDVVFPLKKKNMGISGAMVPEKTCTSRLCTHEHTINVIAPTLRERQWYTHSKQQSVVAFQTRHFCPWLSKLFVWGFFVGILLRFVQSPTRVCFYRLSPLRKFVFTFSCSGCHYYTHIYIIIYKKLGVRRTGRALLFSSRVHLNKSLKKNINRKHWVETLTGRGWPRVAVVGASFNSQVSFLFFSPVKHASTTTTGFTSLEGKKKKKLQRGAFF